MKYSHKHIFVLSLFVFSTATNYCMEEKLGLKPYEPDTIENIKKQHDNFIQLLHNTDNFLDIPTQQVTATFKAIYLEKREFYLICTPTLFNDHSMLSVILLNPYIEKIAKMNRIHELRYTNSYIKIKPTPKDLQFAELELYERRYALKDKIVRLYEAKPHIEHITKQGIPHEIMRHIGMLMLDTEKSLL